MKLLENILRWANLLLIMATLLAYIAPWINPAKAWHFTFLGLAYPFLLFANVFFVIFWGLRRDRYTLYSIGCILVGLGYFGGFFSLNFSDSTKNKDAEITVLTYNIGALGGYDWSESERKASLKKQFEKFSNSIEMPDVLCIQEGKGEKLVGLIRQTFNYPHHFQVKNTVTFSKFPIKKGEAVKFENTGNSCVWTDLETPNGTIRVYNVHLQSNKLGQTADKIATKGNINDKETWSDIRFVMRRYKNAVAIRAEQAQLVAGSMAKSPHPVILCGDMNDPPVSFVYKLLSKDLQDSFCEKGSGFGSTFAGKLPFLRIDFVLPSHQFKVTNHKVLRTKLSDHYPVEVSLRKITGADQ